MTQSINDDLVADVPQGEQDPGQYLAAGGDGGGHALLPEPGDLPEQKVQPEGVGVWNASWGVLGGAAL